MNLEKLKDTARKFEQKEEWRKAIEVYLKAIHQIEDSAEVPPDLSLYNRIGDLHLKINDIPTAVRSYERAVDLYADQGFFNNAIALCGKILRVNPARTQTYLKLAQLHARKNVVIEAKRNLIEFLERMNALGQLEQAFQSVKEFADQFSGSQEIRMMLVELLRAASREDEAREQLEKMAADLEARGDTAGARRTREQLQAIEHAGQAGSPAEAPRSMGGLVFLDTGVSPSPPAPSAPTSRVPAAPAGPDAPPAPPGLMTTAEATPPPAAPESTDDALLSGLERTSEIDLSMGTGEAGESVVEPLEIDRVEPAEGFEATHVEGLGDTRLEGLEDGPLDRPPLDVPLDGITLDAPDDLVTAFSDADTALDALSEPILDPGLEPGFREELMEGLEPGRAAELEPGQEADLGLVRDTDLELVRDTDPEPGRDADLVEPIDLDLGDIDLDIEAAGAESPAVDLPFIEGGDDDDAPAGSALVELENQVLDDPENPDVHRDLAGALFAADQPERAVDELDLALTGYEARGDWASAFAVAEQFLAVYPDSVVHHQKRVELAYRMGERGPLIEAYLALAASLARTGATSKAIAVYHRVQEHEPGNARAAAALAELTAEQGDEAAPTQAEAPENALPQGTPARPAMRPMPAESAPPADAVAAPSAPAPLESDPAASAPPERVTPAAASASSASSASGEPPASGRASPSAPSSSAEFIDLGSLIFEDPGPRDTRMRIDRKDPTGEDEQKEFQEILEQFKRGIEQNLGDEDHQAHYDLGVAFKEMGLLDEAIAEFQKALRASEGRLRTCEALGAAFFDKGQYAVAEAVLRRAVEVLDGGDDAKIALVYWLGRAMEAQGKESEAIAYYERALAVDIRFMDLGERLQRLSAGRRP